MVAPSDRIATWSDEPERTLGLVPSEPATPPRLARLDIRRLPPPNAGRLLTVGRVVAGGCALLVAVVVLVLLRLPDTRPGTGLLDGRLDAIVRRTVLADRALAVTSWVATVATLVVLGGVIFRLAVVGPAQRAVLRGHSGDHHRRPAAGRGSTMEREAVMTNAAWIGSGAGVLAIFLRAISLSGVGVGVAASLAPARLGFVLGSPFGLSTLLRTAGLALLGRAPHERRAWWLGGLVILGSYSLVGHPRATGSPASLLVAVQVVHVTVAATWFGGLVFLVLELRRRRRSGDPRGSALLVTRFSTVASLGVVLAATTGALLGRSQLGSLDALGATPYGRALLAKLACVALVLALGAYNRLFLVPAIDRTDARRAWTRFRRTCVAEALVMAFGVLLATAAMTSGGL